MAGMQFAPVQYNTVPETSVLKKWYKPLEAGEQITFRIKGSYDPTNPKKRITRTLMLPQTDVVRDPETGQTYDIAYISGIGQGGMPIMGEIWLFDSHGSALTLNGNRAEDIRKYNYIMTSNYLADNPYSDPKKHLIEIENDEKDRAYVRSQRQKKREALRLVDSMSDQDILDFIRANRMGDRGTPLKRRYYLEDLAESQPDLILAAPMKDHTSLYPLIDELRKKNVITFDNSARAVVMYTGDEVVAWGDEWKLGMVWKDELAKFLMKPENSSVLRVLKGELSKDAALAESAEETTAEAETKEKAAPAPKAAKGKKK